MGNKVIKILVSMGNYGNANKIKNIYNLHILKFIIFNTSTDAFYRCYNRLLLKMQNRTDSL